MKGFWKDNWAAVFLMLLAAASIALGIDRGEMATVASKAVRICLECIGIG